MRSRQPKLPPMIKPNQLVVGYEPVKPQFKNFQSDPVWLELRGSMIGTWKEKAEENIQKLKEYLGPIRDRRDPKYRRVHSYLTSSGFGRNGIQHPAISRFLIEIGVRRP